MSTCVIPLGRAGQYEAIVSAEDYAYLTQWRWTFKVSRGGKVYARRCRQIDGRKTTILMHDVVLLECKGEPRPSPKHTGDHLNRHSLDNTRDNLKWSTTAQQARNRRHCLRRAEPVTEHAIPF